MKYTYDYEIKYQEVDAERRLRLYNLENYLLEVAGRVADDLGFGIAYLYPQGLTWVLTHLSVEMTYLPTHCDKIRIETWIENNAHMLSIRDFRLYLLTGEGEQRLIGKARTQWAVLDLQKREIVNIFDRDVFAGHIDGEVLDLTRAPRLHPIAEPTGIVPHTVLYSDTDYNGHCNSCKYLERMLDAALPDYGTKTVRLDIQYQHEVKPGETFDTLYLVLPDGIQYQQKKANGDTACAAKVTIIG